MGTQRCLFICSLNSSASVFNQTKGFLDGCWFKSLLLIQQLDCHTGLAPNEQPVTHFVYGDPGWDDVPALNVTCNCTMAEHKRKPQCHPPRKAACSKLLTKNFAGLYSAPGSWIFVYGNLIRVCALRLFHIFCLPEILKRLFPTSHVRCIFDIWLSAALGNGCSAFNFRQNSFFFFQETVFSAVTKELICIGFVSSLLWMVSENAPY